MGFPESRIAGCLKLTGKAKYSAEFPIPSVLYGFSVCINVVKSGIVFVNTQ